MTATTTERESIHNLVRERYSTVASQSDSAKEKEAEYYKRVATAFGYGEDDLALLDGANMGLSCGNPIATAHLREGEVVVDLGSGGGMDVILAAKKVGVTGKAIGIDMTPEMIELAERNAAARGLTNTQFIQSKIESLPLESESADCIISNCVLNLVPEEDKGVVLREVFRVLKRGGRLAISDIVATENPMPEALKEDVVAYVGCVSGAIGVAHYTRLLKEAGFSDIVLVDTKADLNVYTRPAQNEATTSCCSAPSDSIEPIKEASSAPAPSCCAAPSQETTQEKTAAASCCGAPSKSVMPIKEASSAPAPSCCAAPSQETTQEKALASLGQYDLNKYIGSYKIYALKAAV